MKKKVLAAILSAMMVFGLAACGNTGSSKEKTYTIGISQFAEHGSLDNCREGFLAGLAEEGFVELEKKPDGSAAGCRGAIWLFLTEAGR